MSNSHKQVEIDLAPMMTGSTPATSCLTSQGTATQEADRPTCQCLQIHKSGTIYTHSYVPTNKNMYNWILLNTCSLINQFCNQSFVECAPSEHNVIPCNKCRSDDDKPEGRIAWYGMEWFDSKAMTNVLSFGNVAKRYPI